MMTVETIEKSLNDSRLYKYIQLPNGLRILLIRDPEMALSQDAPGENELSSNTSEGSEDSFDEVAYQIVAKKASRIQCMGKICTDK